MRRRRDVAVDFQSTDGGREQKRFSEGTRKRATMSLFFSVSDIRVLTILRRWWEVAGGNGRMAVVGGGSGMYET